MSDALERCARALQDTWNSIEGLPPIDFLPHESEYLVRAVLQALREPDEAMLAAAKPEPTHLYGEGNRGADYQAQMKVAVSIDRQVARQIWQAMIDAALSPSDQSAIP